jgi:hypothetical protein
MRPAAPNGSSPVPNEPGVQTQYGRPAQQAQYAGYATATAGGDAQRAIYQQPLPGPQEAAYPNTAQPALYQPPAQGQ